MNKFFSLFLLVAVLGAHQATARVTKAEFFPYGLSNSDQQLPLGNDLHVTHQLAHPITFFNQPHDTIYVNNDGTISFNGAVPEFTPTCGSASLPRPTIIPFWADINIQTAYNLTGEPGVFFRESTAPADLAHATQETLTAFPGLHSSLNINRVFIATWIDVAFYGSINCGEEAKAKRNTFQAVIATDGSMSFIIFNYDEVTWTAGTDSGADCTGLGGTPARAGFDAGDHVNIYNLPGSCSDEIFNVVETTNVNQPGKWIFRVDQEHIEDPPPATDAPEIPTEESPIPEPGHCDPDNCNLLGYCFQYAKCDAETRTYLTHHCPQGLYWNPHNNSLTAPDYDAIAHEGHGPVAAVGRSLITLTRQLDNNGEPPVDATEYQHEWTEAPAHDHHHEKVHGTCDVWENLSPEVQHVYLNDQQCFPKCYYAPIAQCENRYVYHPHNTDARHVEYVTCPVDTRHGGHTPMVWVQERETCDLCENSYRIDEHGNVSSCCVSEEEIVEPTEGHGEMGPVDPEEHHPEQGTPAEAPPMEEPHHEQDAPMMMAAGRR